MRHLTLGFDLGPNSIGWALVEEDDTGPKSLEAIGVRVFSGDGREKDKDPKEPQETRREAGPPPALQAEDAARYAPERTHPVRSST